MHILLNTYLAHAEVVAETSAPAAEPAKNSDLLGALGIDVRLLVLQMAAFLLLVWALKKWVYPILIKAIDDRQAAMEAGIKASEEAKKVAEKAEEQVAKELEAARKQADEILVATQKEAAAIVGDAEEKAQRRAENIVAEAKADMNNQLQAARESLKAETRDLVARATEQIIGEKVDASKDAHLVDGALKKARGEA
jgi:F-type H+-transporting ATPase subunit b